MASLREQIATTALTVTKFRELLRTMRANCPGENLDIVRKAYEFSQEHTRARPARQASRILFIRLVLPWC